MSDRWMEQLSEYLDGELPVIDRAALEVHLETCNDCSTLLGDLRRVVDRARVAEEYAPRRDLWSGIATRIGATPASSPRIGPKWSFSLPQVATRFERDALVSSAIPQNLSCRILPRTGFFHLAKDLLNLTARLQLAKYSTSVGTYVQPDGSVTTPRRGARSFPWAHCEGRSHSRSAAGWRAM